MIGFLQPLAWLAAAGAAIPLVLHLIRRREFRRVIFPAVRYLRRAERQHARRLRLRHLLLLVARVFIVVLLTAAAAGPLIGRGGAADHEPTALALIVDNSASAARIHGERRLVDLFTERARLAIDLANADDEIAAFAAVRTDPGPISRDLEAARRLIDSLRPVAGVADLTAALQQAVSWLRGQTALVPEIHLLTDLQRTSLGPARSAEPIGHPVHVVVYSPDLGPEANGALGPLEPEVLPLTTGQPVRVSAPLHWFGPGEPLEPVLVRLVLEGEVVALTEARYAASGLFTLPGQRSDWVQGRAEIDAAGFTGDDRRYFTFPANPPVSFAVRGTPNTFLGAALQALELGGRLAQASPEAAEVWICPAAADADRGRALGVSVVVLPPEDVLQVPQVNSRLERAGIPWRLEAAAADRGSSRIVGTAMRGLAELEVRRSYRLVPSGLAGSDSVLLTLESGEPWLVQGTGEGGASYLLIGSPLTPEASDLPVSASMVPFLDVLLGQLARGRRIAADSEGPARRLRLPPRAVWLEGPEGDRTRVEGDAPFQAEVAGNYLVRDADDRPVFGFSVNVPLAESDFEQAQPAELEPALSGAVWTWRRGGYAGEWAEDIYQARRGRHLWRPLVVMLFVVSIVEASLAAAGRRHSAPSVNLKRPEPYK